MNKALFLDRDGTINIDSGYVHEKENFVFIDGIFAFCRHMQTAGYKIIVITNQSGIARGYFTETAYHELTQFMIKRFADEGVQITDVFHCPFLDGFDRKPNCGLFLKAKTKHDVDMRASVNIGDQPRDLEAGRAAGVGTNLLFTGSFDELESQIRLHSV